MSWEDRMTYIDANKYIYSYENNKGELRKIISFGSVFCCKFCYSQQVMVFMAGGEHKGKLRIEEYHQKECEYYKEI